jgi:hypothetical protein
VRLSKRRECHAPDGAHFYGDVMMSIRGSNVKIKQKLGDIAKK